MYITLMCAMNRNKIADSDVRILHLFSKLKTKAPGTRHIYIRILERKERGWKAREPRTSRRGRDQIFTKCTRARAPSDDFIFRGMQFI